MNEEKDFKDLIEGYRVSLHLLKISEPALYEKFLETKEALEANGAKFSAFIRNLKVDFLNSNKQEDAASKTMIQMDENRRYYLFYSPTDNWSLHIIFKEKRIVGEKNIYITLYPFSINKLEKDVEGLCYQIAYMKPQYKGFKRFFEYIVGYSHNEIMLFKRDVGNPNKIIKAYETNAEKVLKNEETNIF